MNEEFRSAMEEIQSSNEELQSTNEELETTKEELQSTNEELMTVNEEMLNRNTELGRVNDDLVNLLNNVSLPLVILTSDLRIRRYTAIAESILNLIPSDVGRPFSDLRTKLAFPDLEERMQEVLDHLTPQEMEVQDMSGRWHRLRIRPFTTSEKRIDGVVLTLLDIDEAKRAMERQQHTQHFSDAIIQTIREPLLVLDADLRVEIANRSFYRFFLVSPAETEKNHVFNLGNGQWNIPELRRLLEEILPMNSSFNDFVIEHDFPQIGRKRMILNARKISAEDTAAEAKILLAIEEDRGQQ
jgi:two-component system CheB/CheR fusion protein